MERAQPLPCEVAQTYQWDPNVASAYELILNLESDISRNDNGKIGQTRENLMYCRILGYLLHYPPQYRALKTIYHEIFKCDDDQARLLNLGKWYFDHFIMTCTFFP